MHAAINKYHETVIELWKSEHSSDSNGFHRWPMLGPPPVCEKVEVVTLGFNPSYVLTELEKHWCSLRETDKTMPAWGAHTLAWDPNESEIQREKRRDLIKRLDKYSRETYRSYYEPIRTLVAAAGREQTWYHMDAFPLRETHARKLRMYTPVPANEEAREQYAEAEQDVKSANVYRWNGVFNKLFDASIELLSELRPKVVVVLNSHVSRMLHHKLPLRLQANGHRYESVRMPGTVFLLGSQLSGGAISTYGKERLLADLRDVIRGKEGLDGGEA